MYYIPVENNGAVPVLYQTPVRQYEYRTCAISTAGISSSKGSGSAIRALLLRR
eukprot:SAG31_NODE_33620_length_341_cov_3.814050_1_plen_52_part_10